jgi:hypothetical protein
MLTFPLTPMLKGSREGILRRIQPYSIHGQISWDVHFTDPEAPDGQVTVARIGPEAVDKNLQPGDRIEIDYVLGVATQIRKLVST